MASTSTHNQSVKLTKTNVDRAPNPARGQAFLRDTELKGFALRITPNGVRSFVVEKRIEGRVRRITLARFGELTCEQARREAQKILGKVAMGENPYAERARTRAQSLTLEQAFAEFRQVRKTLKPRTLYDYNRLLQTALGDWRTRPLAAITRDAVSRRHLQLGEQHGETYASSAMRFLRAVINFAIAHYDDGSGNPTHTDNPVTRLTHTRAWYREERRQTVIKVHKLQPWFRAVAQVARDPAPLADVVADYLLFLVFSGLRRQEAAQLRWDQVDMV